MVCRLRGSCVSFRFRYLGLYARLGVNHQSQRAVVRRRLKRWPLDDKTYLGRGEGVGPEIVVIRP